MAYLLGLVGHPVSHSLSPPMHKAALAHYGLAGDYQLIDLAAPDLAAGLKRLAERGFTGVNVTVPHKRNVIEFLDDLTHEARAAGAVNTVAVRSSGTMVGHNTDLGGFMLALSQDCPAAAPGSRALVVGAGGAARAALCGLIALGWSELGIVSRRAESVHSLIAEANSTQSGSTEAPAHLFAVEAESCGKSASGTFQLIVNCTPAGLLDDQLPDWMEGICLRLAPGGFLFDMVYRRDGKETPLVALARKNGYKSVDGISMLVNQAALSFNFWTGRPGPVEVMKNALRL